MIQRIFCSFAHLLFFRPLLTPRTFTTPRPALVVEQLEDRTLLAPMGPLTLYWVANQAGNFSDKANWRLAAGGNAPRAPQNGDTLLSGTGLNSTAQ